MMLQQCNASSTSLTPARLTTVNLCWCPRGTPQDLPVQALPPLELVTGRDPTVDNSQTTVRAVERRAYGIVKT